MSINNVDRPQYSSRVHPTHEAASSQLYSEVYFHAKEGIAALEIQINDLHARLNEDHPNLLDIHDLLKNVNAELERLQSTVEGVSGNVNEINALSAMVDPLKKAAQRIGIQLVSEPLVERFKEQEKWVKAGYDRALITSDPEAVHFAVSTKLIYTIGMYEKSANILAGEKLTIRNDGGVAKFKVEGEWVSYASFKKRITYCDREQKFIGWNFIHPEGFIPRDWAEYGHIYPIAQLTPDAYRKIKAHADQFWSPDQPQIDPGQPKDFILQVMTTGRDLLPKTWWAKNFTEHFPEHGSIRLITPDGRVYSFGTKLRLPDQDYLCSVSTYLGTGLSNVPTPDYEEPRKSDDRLMVCLPITRLRFDSIIDFVNRANGGISFNFARQNCVRFVATVLNVAGVDLSIKTHVHELLGNIVPRLSDIPRIGKQLSALVTKIACIVSSIFDTLTTILKPFTPYPLLKIWEWAVWITRSILQRIEAIFWNVLGLCVLGASKSIFPENKMDDSYVPEVETFHHLINWSDLLTPNAIPIYYVTKLKEWMRKQKTALLFVKPEHGFCCFDPATAASRGPLRV